MPEASDTDETETMQLLLVQARPKKRFLPRSCQVEEASVSVGGTRAFAARRI
jgi:hypothetical protein